MKTAVVTLVVLLSLNLAIAEEKECAQRKENIYTQRSQSPQRLFDQDFGMALTPSDFLSMMSPFSPFMYRDYFRPWRQLASLTKDLGSSIKADKEKFQINLDVQHFSPDEITVKVADGYINVEAKHEEKEDEHGYISRQFMRRYSLPDDIEPENVVSQLSSDGVLTVSAPRQALENKNERVVPITQTGPVRKESKEAISSDTCTSEACVSDEKRVARRVVVAESSFAWKFIFDYCRVNKVKKKIF